jgi:hypothetical protein
MVALPSQEFGPPEIPARFRPTLASRCTANAEPIRLAADVASTTVHSRRARVRRALSRAFARFREEAMDATGRSVWVGRDRLESEVRDDPLLADLGEADLKRAVTKSLSERSADDGWLFDLGKDGLWRCVPGKRR